MSQQTPDDQPTAGSPHQTDPQPPTTEMGYGAAISELDTILGELEASDVDVDLLASRVARAAELIEFCRDRIDNARLTINQVVGDLDRAQSQGPTSDTVDVDVDVDVAER